MSFVCWLTELATFPVLFATSIIALVAAVIVILCRVVWENNYTLEELERQMSSETYIEDQLEWLKEAAESLFPPGSSRLEEEIDGGGSERTVAEDKDFPADDDSSDGDYKYERLSQFSSEYDDPESDQEWERVT
jgi:hypothetical protein